MRLIDTIIEGDRTAKIYRDAEWDEYRVKFFVSGVHQVGADYHCVDRVDAVATAEATVQQGWVQKSPRPAAFPFGPSVGA